MTVMILENNQAK